MRKTQRRGHCPQPIPLPPEHTLKHFLFISLCLSLFFSVQSCDWDHSLVEFTGERCPPDGNSQATFLNTLCSNSQDKNCKAYDASLQRCADSLTCVSIDEETFDCLPPCNTDDTAEVQLIRCGAQCIDPNTSSTNCGAKGQCNNSVDTNSDFRGKECENNEKCIDGVCALNSCATDETLCIENGIRSCKNTTNGINNCGACGYNCEKNMPPNTIAKCENQKCDYPCMNGFEKCGQEGNVCLKKSDMLNNPLCCAKELSNEPVPCQEKQFCFQGECKENTCENACAIVKCSSGEQLCDCSTEDCTVECVNTNNSCGSSCQDCMNIPGSTAAECKDTVCTNLNCQTGYHPNGNPVTECIKDSEKSCGISGEDCTKLNNVANASCVSGECQITECKPGFCNVDRDPSNGCEQYAGQSGQCCVDDKPCPEVAFRKPFCVKDNNSALKCDYQCADGYTNCGTTEAMRCIDYNWTADCNDCSHCTDGQKCSLGFFKYRCK